MGERRYTAAQVDAAVAALGDAQRFAHAQEIVTHAAPGLQRILSGALQAGGFFDAAHDGETARVAAIEDPAERLTGVRTLVAEETRIGMLVGVAVGLELADELRRRTDTDNPGGASA
ncbi:MAG TPA: hypothetical protein VMT10_02645 [Solirubrobacteraceae bacterium]|nr:hypothetical protein [Solirubrobacteraceae bacterium]